MSSDPKTNRKPSREATAALHLGSLRVPLSVHGQILAAVRAAAPTADPENKRSNRNKAGYIWLLRRGLANIRIDQLLTTSRSIRRLLEQTEQIDLTPGLCPRGVDPLWWAEQELERLQRGVEEVKTATSEALRLSRNSLKIETEVGVLTEGS